MRAKIDKSLIKTLIPADKPFDCLDAQLRGFLLRIEPSGRMSYFISYRRADGRRTRFRIGTAEELSPVQARDEATRLLATIRLGEDPAGEKRHRRRALTLREFVEGPYGEWAKAHRKTGHEKIVRIKGSFVEFLDKPLAEITAWDVDQWRSARGKQKARKSGTLNRDLAYLKAALSKAVEWRMIQEHPLRTVKLLREDRKPRERYLTDEEEGRLMSALDRREERLLQKEDARGEWCRMKGIKSPPETRTEGFRDYLKPLVLLALGTGMRWGELTTLEWADVDLSKNRILLRGTLTKSSQSRSIPLTETAAGTLQMWKRQTGGDGLVFESPRGGRLKSIRDPWAAVLADAEIEGFHFHDLRHTYASRLVAAGGDLYVIKELLGHSTIAVTERYSHVPDSLKVATVARLDARPDNVVPLAEGQRV